MKGSMLGAAFWHVLHTAEHTTYGFTHNIQAVRFTPGSHLLLQVCGRAVRMGRPLMGCVMGQVRCGVAPEHEERLVP